MILSKMLTHSMFTRIVDKINNQYGTVNYLPAEYLWQNHVYAVKAFGIIVWDSENCSATSETTIENLIYRYINKYILTPVWKEQVEYFKDEILWKMEDEGVADGHVESIREYFDKELEMLKEV